MRVEAVSGGGRALPAIEPGEGLRLAPLHVAAGGGAGEGGARPLLRSRAVIEWPVRMRGELYLTPREICFVRRRELLGKREEEAICASIEQVKDVRFAGLLSRKIALDVAYGEGAVARYMIRVPNPDLWVSYIRELKGAAPPPRGAEG